MEDDSDQEAEARRPGPALPPEPRHRAVHTWRRLLDGDLVVVSEESCQPEELDVQLGRERVVFGLPVEIVELVRVAITPGSRSAAMAPNVQEPSGPTTA